MNQGKSGTVEDEAVLQKTGAAVNVYRPNTDDHLPQPFFPIGSQKTGSQASTLQKDDIMIILDPSGLENLTSPKERELKTMMPGFPNGPPNSPHNQPHIDKHTQISHQLVNGPLLAMIRHSGITRYQRKAPNMKDSDQNKQE